MTRARLDAALAWLREHPEVEVTLVHASESVAQITVRRFRDFWRVQLDLEAPVSVKRDTDGNIHRSFHAAGVIVHHVELAVARRVPPTLPPAEVAP